jgi:hypothetical protein
MHVIKRQKENLGDFGPLRIVHHYPLPKMSVFLYKLHVNGMRLVRSFLLPIMEEQKPRYGVTPIDHLTVGVGRKANVRGKVSGNVDQRVESFKEFGFIRLAVRILEPKENVMNEQTRRK